MRSHFGEKQEKVQDQTILHFALFIRLTELRQRSGGHRLTDTADFFIRQM